MDRAVWEPLLLVATAALVVGLPWRVHVSTVRWPQRWLALPDLLVSLTIVVATAWAVVTVLDGRSPTHVLPAAVTAVLAAGAELARSRSGLNPATPVLPVWFVPAVLAVSAVAAAAWSVARGTGYGAEVGVAALVMAGPAAALIAVPVAFAAGSSQARAAGVRLGGLRELDAATRVDTLVLDKNGVLTTGDLTVVSVDPVEPDHERNLRWFAGALEKASDHRIGRAIATLSARGRLENVEVLPGQGIRGSVDRHPVRVGSPAWVGIEASPTIWTTVGVEVDGRALGSITVADDVRPDLARDTQKLTDLDLRLVLVSGDTAERTGHVASLAGIDTYHPASGPEGSADVLRALAADGRVVATAGLVAAGASLTFTTSDERDDTVPMIGTDDLAPARLARALSLARTTAVRVRRAGRVTVVLGAVGVVLAAAGVVGPLVAAGTAVAVFAGSAAAALAG